MGKPFLYGILLGAIFMAPAALADKRPNILIVLIDDLGYNDLGANGNPEAPTPEMDRLAASGVRFTRNYTDATCSPTRVGLFTGTHAATHGFRPTHHGISPEVTTLAESLKSVGYDTHHVGKWHMGHTTRLARPTAQGFDTFFGFLNQFFLKGPDKNGKRVYKRPDYQNPWLETQADPPRQYKGHLTDILTDHTVDLIGKKTEKDPPWFLNLWYYAPHTPLQPTAVYRNRFPKTPKGTYYAVVRQLDANIGRILKALDDTGQRENTLVMVLSDNGGTNRQVPNNAPFYGLKATFNEGGVRTPFVMGWPTRIKGGRVFDGMVTQFDIFPTAAAAAGAKMPSTLIGKDLLMALDGGAFPQKALYYCYSDSENYSIGMLSKDGRWRMVHDFQNPLRLYDLASNPAGDTDVSSTQKKMVEKQHGEFIRWHRHTRIPALQYKRLSPDGKARITGDSLQRSPGYGGFTFGVPLHPKAMRAHREVIVFQKNQWSLWRERDGVRLRIGGIEVTGPPIETGISTTIAVTAHFRFSALRPQVNRAIIDIYMGDRLVARRKIQAPRIPEDDFLHPTWIGRNDQGKFPFSGTMAKPVFLNERVVPMAQAKKIGNDIDTLLKELDHMEPGTGSK